MFDIEIDPVEKLDDLCALLADQQIEVHKAPDADLEYHYLREGYVCVTVLNPYSICSASIYYGTDKKWLGNTCIQ